MVRRTPGRGKKHMYRSAEVGGKKGLGRYTKAEKNTECLKNRKADSNWKDNRKNSSCLTPLTLLQFEIIIISCLD